MNAYDGEYVMTWAQLHEWRRLMNAAMGGSAAATHKAADYAEQFRQKTCRMTKVRDGLVHGWWRCSECGGYAPAPDEFSFCPYCGARVVPDEKEEPNGR